MQKKPVTNSIIYEIVKIFNHRQSSCHSPVNPFLLFDFFRAIKYLPSAQKAVMQFLPGSDVLIGKTFLMNTAHNGM